MGEREALLQFGPKLYIQEAQIRAILQKALGQILIWFAFDLCVVQKSTKANRNPLTVYIAALNQQLCNMGNKIQL